MCDSLNTHIARGWRLPAMLDFYVEPVPAQQRTRQATGSGARPTRIYQSLNVITDEDPDFVAVFGGDHIYKMDVRQMLDFHLEHEADAHRRGDPGAGRGGRARSASSRSTPTGA